MSEQCKMSRRDRRWLWGPPIICVAIVLIGLALLIAWVCTDGIDWLPHPYYSFLLALAGLWGLILSIVGLVLVWWQRRRRRSDEAV